MPNPALSAVAGAFAVTALSLGAAHAAPVSLEETGNHYAFFEGDYSYTGAATAAADQVFTFKGEEFSGFLATITSEAENDFISKLGKEGWLGGSDSAVEGTWKWTQGPDAGSAFTYTNWHPKEPDDAGAGEDHLAMRPNGKWNDVSAQITSFETVKTNCVASDKGKGRSKETCDEETRAVTTDREMGFFVEFATSTAQAPVAGPENLAPVPVPPMLPALLLGVGGLVALKRRMR